MSLIPKNIDDKLKSKNVDTEKFKNLAAGVKPSDLEDEKKVRQLIRQLASIANTEIDAAKEEQILAYIKKYKIHGGNMGLLTSLLKKKL